MTEQTMTGPDLRRLREQAGVSMQEISRRLSIHEPSLSLIERGYRVMPDGLPSRYKEAVVAIARERHEAAVAATETH